jgi:hypothetical protein
MFEHFSSKAEVVRAIKAEGFNVSSLLAKPESNPKIAKNGKLGVLAAPLHLAPFNLSGFQVCAQASAGCAAACLHTAGNPAYMAGKDKARKEKTRLYFLARPLFMALLAFEIDALQRKAKKLGMHAAVRLNATSDLPWEVRKIHLNGAQNDVLLMDHFSDVTFYDYTKITKRALAAAQGKMPSNYYLTFSRTEDNDADVKRVLAAGGNVAMVLSTQAYKAAMTASLNARQWDAIGHGKIIDGDAHDFRAVDPKNVVVALKAKGDARHDTSGFVIR